MPEKKILVVEDDEMMRDFLEEALETYGYKPLCAVNASEGLKKFRQNDPVLVVADIKMPGRSGLDFLEDLRELDRRVPVIIITAYADTDAAVKALRNRADDFLRKPFEAEQFIQSVEANLDSGKSRSASGDQEYNLVYESSEMEDLVDYARRISDESEPVLIEGESGVGKEVLARYIHYQSPRGDTPLVTVNCGAIPGELMESELFGHTEGAFTGANTEREGIFQAADEGTLLLDEVGDLPLELQSKLLRALENSRVKPVGSDTAQPVDVRIIAASNRDLELMVDRGEFRDDLFYRLNVFSLSIPPLRQRREDIPVLADYFLDQLELDVEVSDAAFELLKNYEWPGNVREFKNVLRRLLPLKIGCVLEPEDLRKAGLEATPGEEISGDESLAFPPEPDLRSRLEKLKKEYIKKALDEAGGNKTRAAEILGMNRTTLVEAINRLNLQ